MSKIKQKELEEVIKDLFCLKQEGEYWDFKEKWHENKALLLHDIICMANNQGRRGLYTNKFSTYRARLKRALERITRALEEGKLEV